MSVGNVNQTAACEICSDEVEGGYAAPEQAMRLAKMGSLLDTGEQIRDLRQRTTDVAHEMEALCALMQKAREARAHRDSAHDDNADGATFELPNYTSEGAKSFSQWMSYFGVQDIDVDPHAGGEEWQTKWDMNVTSIRAASDNLEERFNAYQTRLDGLRDQANTDPRIDELRETIAGLKLNIAALQELAGRAEAARSEQSSAHDDNADGAKFTLPGYEDLGNMDFAEGMEHFGIEEVDVNPNASGTAWRARWNESLENLSRATRPLIGHVFTDTSRLNELIDEEFAEESGTGSRANALGDLMQMDLNLRRKMRD